MKGQKGLVALIWSAADKILTNSVTLVISIILARLIEPSEHGILATASIFTVVLSLFVEPGMTSGLIQKKDSDRLDFSTILSFNIVIGVCLYLLLFGLSNPISLWFDMPILSAVIKVLGLQIIIGSINSVQIAYVQKNMLFKRYFMCSFVSVLFSAIVGIVLAYRGAGVWALVIYNLLKQLTNVIMIFLLFHYRFELKFSKERFQKMFPFAGGILFTKFIDQGYIEITQTIISKRYSAADLAFYNKGKSFPELIINSVNSALSNVMFPYFSEKQDEFDELKRTMRISVRMTSYICIPMMIGLMTCAENFIKVVLTERWIDSVPFLQLSCICYLFIPFSNIIWQSLKAIGKSEEILKLEIIKMVLSVISLIALIVWLQSPIAIVISIAFSYMISFFVECFVASKCLDYSIRNVIEDFVPSFIVACCMGIIVLALGKMNLSAIFELIIQVISGIIIYFFLTYVLKFPQIEQIKAIIKRKD